jgi:O-antigen ligase
MNEQARSVAAAQTWTEPDDTAFTGWLRRVMVVGMLWLVAGMAVMPAGPSYNPSKAYQYLLALTLWLPALFLAVRYPRRLLAFLRLPLIPWAIALLVWGWVSLGWTHAVRPVDEVARNLSILLFLFACQWVFGSNAWRTRRVLIGSSMIMALVALVNVAAYALHPPAGGRLIGVGVMANSNLAAAGMAAAMLWLWPWRGEGRAWILAKWLAISVLILFVLLTFTRSAWAGMFAALVALVLCQGGRRAWFYAGVICVLGALGALAGLHVLMERGWSLRPQIFAQSMDLIMQHPLRGLGQGSAFQIDAGTEVLDHAHNMFTQLAIELGLPAALLWVGIWLALGWRAWRHRHQALGLAVLGLWVFATVAVQFDLPHLLDSPRPGWLITWLPLALSTLFDRQDSTLARQA